RLKTDEQRQQLTQLQKDVFDPTKNIIQTLKRFGFKIITNMTDVTTRKNICYFNFRREIVNSHIHKLIKDKPKHKVRVDKFDYWPGMEITCKEHFKDKGKKLFVNYVYTITYINNETFTVQDIAEGTTMTLPLSQLTKHFSQPYANTCHSVQGLSLDVPITIFDVNTPYADRYFVWTALTRATDFNNVTIFEHSVDDVVKLRQQKVKQYFKKKVEDYKKQDKKSGRWKPDKEGKFQEIEDYIDEDWFNDEYSKLKTKVCAACNVPYDPPHIDHNANVTSTITADRINNKLSHTKSNCRLLCIKCNRIRGNKY
ncbi:MAG TPA: hypothetical protein PLS50_07960, partial [Candidatus Dojkabacteria bacterium]|nr:hypothetical protein [Candidatus Dojkabacteria bacterium]